MRGVSRRIPEQPINERLEQRRSTGKDFSVRHSSVMDLDPSDVPREGKYFLVSITQRYFILELLYAMYLLYYTVLHRIVLYCLALYCTVLHCTTLYRTALHCMTLYCTARHYIVLHCIAWHCIAQHCIAMHGTIFHCIVLQCSSKDFFKGWRNSLKFNPLF